MTTVYLLHYRQPIGNLSNRRAQAQHYLGCTRNLERRLKEHRRGTQKASTIVRAFHAAGIEFEVARTWDGGFDLEKQLKRRKKARKLCPICKGELR